MCLRPCAPVRVRAHRCGLNVTVIVELEVLTAEAPARPAKECVAQTQGRGREEENNGTDEDEMEGTEIY